MQKSLDLCGPQDGLGRGRCLGQLGEIARKRFELAREAGYSQDQLTDYLDAALTFSQKALAEFPETAVADRAVIHGRLGSILYYASRINDALAHYRESIRYEEQQDDLYGAGMTRFNVAQAMMSVSHFSDALAYAKGALGNFQTYGDRAADMIEITKQLITDIQRHLPNAQE